MDFRDYFFGLDKQQRLDFAKRVGCSVGHLQNVAYGKICAADYAVSIDRESGGKVPVEVMRPDVDWAYLRSSGAHVSRETAS